MIIAHAGDEQHRVLIFGVDRENVKRLTEGQPIRVSEASHPGVPLGGLTICILYGDTIADIQRQLQPFMNEQTAILDWRGLPKGKAE